MTAITSEKGFGNTIKFGDRMFARLVLRGRTIVEFMISSVNDLTELLGELRRKCSDARGLAKLYLRNMSRGWSMERPLMLYSREEPVRKSPATLPSGGCYRFVEECAESRAQSMLRGEARQLSFPWEL